MSLKLIRIFVYLIPLPVFFGLDFTVFKGTAYDSMQTLPLSFFIILAFGALILKTKRVYNQLDWLMLFVLVYLLSIYLLSNIFIDTTLSPQILLLYSVPMFFGYASGRFLAERFEVADLFRCFFITIGVFCTLHVIYGFAQYGIVGNIVNQSSDDLFGLFSIYQKFVSYPLLLAIVLFYSIFSQGNLTSSVVELVFQLFIFIDMALVAAREPFAMLVVMIGLYLSKNASLKLIFKFLVAFMVFLVILFLFSFVVDFSDLWIVKKFLALEQNSTGGRTEQLEMGYKYIQQLNPFIGEGFSISPHFASGTFHNQWVEYYIKGGALFPFIIFFVLYLSIVKASNLSKIDGGYQLLGIVFISLMIVSFNINTPLRTPYTSDFVWLLVGFVSGKSIVETRF